MNALARNAPPFPLNPTTGERFGQWVWNGAQWVCAPANGVQIVVQVFRASGPYMPSSGLVTAVVECVGGGGGGAGVYLPSNAYAGAGGGGGSGGYSRIALPAALVAGGVQVTIGQGGAVSEIVGEAPAGTATTFGALCVANGGQGGVSATISTWGAGGAGALPGTGDIAMPGNFGASGYFTDLAAGSLGMEAGGGAPSVFGGGVRGGGNQGASAPGVSAAPNTGAGGSGAWQNWVTVSTAAPGGGGASGICLVTEYCWAFTGDNDCLNPPINVNARVAVTQVPWPGPGPCPPGWGPGQLDYSD